MASGVTLRQSHWSTRRRRSNKQVVQGDSIRWVAALCHQRAATDELCRQLTLSQRPARRHPAGLVGIHSRVSRVRGPGDHPVASSAIVSWSRDRREDIHAGHPCRGKPPWPRPLTGQHGRFCWLRVWYPSGVYNGTHNRSSGTFRPFPANSEISENQFWPSAAASEISEDQFWPLAGFSGFLANFDTEEKSLMANDDNRPPRYIETPPAPTWVEHGQASERPLLAPEGIDVFVWHRQIGATVALQRTDAVSDDGTITEGTTRIRSSAVDLGPGQTRRHIAELATAVELAEATGSDVDEIGAAARPAPAASAGRRGEPGRRVPSACPLTIRFSGQTDPASTTTPRDRRPIWLMKRRPQRPLRLPLHPAPLG
jgi:hypothetical protein